MTTLSDIQARIAKLEAANKVLREALVEVKETAVFDEYTYRASIEGYVVNKVRAAIKAADEIEKE